eukprot:TRINITY_DN36179_c0_g1_i1.p1 TRINITY_DN36179_c0_g1~~TRINITY_DN36179_c0_g1_i1.p1  ORF type:complete len:275 (+),score=36.13 TRINITY_DN36179_c0_g1_i1:34-825(+)
MDLKRGKAQRSARLMTLLVALFFSTQLLCFMPPGRCSSGLAGSGAALADGSRGLSKALPFGKTLVLRQALPDPVAVKRFLHIGRYITIFQEKWIGPANLDRANLRITGMDTYALVAAVLLQVILGLYGAVPEPTEDDPRIKYPRLQRIFYEIQMGFLMFAVLCSTYTMVTFLLCKIYTVMALALYKDVSYELFQTFTNTMRIRGFWSLIASMLAFLVSFVMNLYTRIKGNRGLIMTACGLACLLPMMQDWRVILDLASKHVYS